MKIYRIAQSGSHLEFAQFAVLGTWSQGTPCASCTATGEQLVSPLVIEWEPASSHIGDFAWDGGYTCIVGPKVERFLSANRFGCQFAPVDQVGPMKGTRKTQERAAMPYSAKQLRWLRPTMQIALDERQSGVRVESICGTCGRIEKTFKFEGIVIPQKSWRPCKLFLIAQNEPSGATFVTEEGRREIEEQRFSNIEFREAGYIA